MTNCKTILIYISGMLTLATILIGADLYRKYSETLCYNQSAPVQDISDLAGGNNAN